MNLYLKKGRSIGNANLPGGKVGPADEDIKLSKRALEVLDKNIEYLKALGIIIEEKDSNVIDVDVEDVSEANDEVNDEVPMFDESDWKDNLNESEQEVYEFLKSQTKKELKSDLKSKGISFKSNALEDDLIRLCMEK